MSNETKGDKKQTAAERTDAKKLRAIKDIHEAVCAVGRETLAMRELVGVNILSQLNKIIEMIEYPKPENIREDFQRKVDEHFRFVRAFLIVITSLLVGILIWTSAARADSGTDWHLCGIKPPPPPGRTSDAATCLCAVDDRSGKAMCAWRF